MKHNDIINTPYGPGKLITMPLPNSKSQIAIVLYPDGRGREVDFRECKPIAD